MGRPPFPVDIPQYDPLFMWPHHMKAFWLRLRAVFERDALDRAFDEEAAAHLELATDEFLRKGFPLSEARRRARLEFGSTQAAKDARAPMRESSPASIGASRFCSRV